MGVFPYRFQVVFLSSVVTPGRHFVPLGGHGLTYWIQKYADARAAWYYGVLNYLESWVEGSGYFLESVGPIFRIDYSSPELATAIGEFVEEMLE